MRWESVDLERGELRLPDSKTGARITHLGESAIAVLRRIQPTKKVRTTARYAHLANDPVKSAANRMASRIAQISGESA